MSNELLNTIIALGGEQKQKIVAIEELSELIKEITKDLRGKGNKVAITEEIADVMIMVNQLFIIYNLDSKNIDKMVNLKLARTIERLSSQVSKTPKESEMWDNGK